MSPIITPSQYLFGMWKDLCGGTNVCSAVKVALSNPIDSPQFLIAYERFYHNSKALHFDIHLGKDSYGEIVLSESSSDDTHLSCFDFSQVAIDNDKDFVESEINHLLSMSLGVSSRDNHFLRVVQNNESELLVFLVVEHLYADGISVDNLLNSYLRQLNNLLDPKSTPIRNHSLPDLSDYQQYQEILNSFVVDYSKSTMTKRYFWSPEKKTLSHLVGSYKTVSSMISAKELKQVTSLVSKKGISLFSYMASCFARAFFNTNLEESELLVQIPTHGRNYAGKTIEKSHVGCFAQSFMLHFERENVEASKAFEVEKQVNEYTIKCSLNEVDQITARRNAKSLINSNVKSRISDNNFAMALRRGMPTNVYFSFYGSSSIDFDQPSLTVSNYYLGTTNLSGGLDVMSALTPDGLVVSFNYDSKFISQNIISEFSDKFRHELLQDLSVEHLSDSPKNDYLGHQKELLLLISIINEFSIDPISIEDSECHLEIDFGLDSLSKTQILARAIASLGLSHTDICRERFYTSSTLNEWYTLFFQQEDMCA